MTKFRSFAPATINSNFMDAVKECPDRVFLEFSGDAYTYGRMKIEVERLARGLHSLGIARGDRVVTLLDNGPDSIIAWLAINWLGAIIVPINTAYAGEYLRHQISDSGARAVLCENEYVERLQFIADKLPAVEHIFFLGEHADRGSWERGFAPLDTLRLDQGEAPYVDVAPSDLTAIIYTSGTTGLSKGCMASHGYLCDLARRNQEVTGRDPEDIQWASVPMFHVSGVCVIFGALHLKATSAIARKFSVSKFWGEIERTKANHTMLLGSMAQMLANQPDTPESLRCKGQLKAIVAAPLSAHLAQIWRERFGVKWPTGLVYGSTECGQALDAPYDTVVPGGSCGRVNDAFDVRVCNEQDEELPHGEVGELLVRPKRPNVMFQGYWNNPEATMKVMRNMWYHMGDNGRRDEDGNFFFVDRSKDVIRRRGENISSFELETTFLTHSDIDEVVIHAVPSAVLEDDVKATVVLRPGARLTEPELLEWARPRIPRFALPRYIEFRAELPKNASGKALKFQLRGEGVTEGTWDAMKAPVA